MDPRHSQNRTVERLPDFFPVSKVVHASLNVVDNQRNITNQTHKNLPIGQKKRFSRHNTKHGNLNSTKDKNLVNQKGHNHNIDFTARIPTSKLSSTGRFSNFVSGGFFGSYRYPYHKTHTLKENSWHYIIVKLLHGNINKDLTYVEVCLSFV